MDQGQALHKLLENADLLGMLEDLLRPERIGELSPASWAGMRITLRQVKDATINSHAELSKGIVKTARNDAQEKIVASRTSNISSSIQTPTHIAAEGGARDLKSALERFVDR